MQPWNKLGAKSPRTLNQSSLMPSDWDAQHPWRTPVSTSKDMGTLRRPFSLTISYLSELTTELLKASTMLLLRRQGRRYGNGGHLREIRTTVASSALRLILTSLLSTVSTPDMASYWREVLKGLESNERDIPLAVLYSLDSDMHDESPTSIIHLQAALGVAEGHPLALRRANLMQDSETILPLLKKTMMANAPTVYQRDDGTLPESLLQGIEWRGFGEPSNALAVLPLTAGEEVLGFLLIGLNPRRAYDEDYGGFVLLLSRQLSTSLTSAALMEQAKRKQAELSKDLAAGESKFKALTELNTAGLSPTNRLHDSTS